MGLFKYSFIFLKISNPNISVIFSVIEVNSIIAIEDAIRVTNGMSGIIWSWIKDPVMMAKL